MKINKLTVTIVALNEEKDLPTALASVKDIAGEIIVVDSGSTDKTTDIAKAAGAKVFTRKFDNFASQKNFAASKATSEWIFSLDADEEVTNELAAEIGHIVGHPERAGQVEESRGNFVAYSIPRKNIILGKFIKYTRWQPELDRHIWLWKKDKGKWEGDIHEEVSVSGTVGRLNGAKIHSHYESVSEFLDMMNKYSEIDASERVKNGTKFSMFRMFIDPLYNFLVRYFYRLGFLDGWRGFVLSYLMAVYHFELWVKIREQK